MSFRKRKRNIKVVISQMETGKGISYNMFSKIMRWMFAFLRDSCLECKILEFGREA